MCGWEQFKIEVKKLTKREFEKGGEEKKTRRKRREKRNVLVPLSNLKNYEEIKTFFWMIDVKKKKKKKTPKW